MASDWPINEYHLKDILNEWNRVIDMEKLYRKCRRDQPLTAKRLLLRPEGLEAFEQAKKILDEPGSYRNSSKEKFAEVFQVDIHAISSVAKPIKLKGC